jgi:hypothetical protein
MALVPLLSEHNGNVYEIVKTRLFSLLLLSFRHNYSTFCLIQVDKTIEKDSIYCS